MSPTQSAMCTSPRRREKARQRLSSSRRKAQTPRSTSPRRPLSPRADQLMQKVSPSHGGGDVLETDKSFRVDSGSLAGEQQLEQENKSDLVETESGGSHFDPQVLASVSSLVGQQLEHHYQDGGDSRKLSPSRRTVSSAAASSMRKQIIRGDSLVSPLVYQNVDSETVQRNDTYNTEEEDGDGDTSELYQQTTSPKTLDTLSKTAPLDTAGISEAENKARGDVLESENRRREESLITQPTSTPGGSKSDFDHSEEAARNHTNAFIGIIHQTDHGMASELEPSLKSAELTPEAIRALGQYIDAISGKQVIPADDGGLNPADPNPETLRALGQYIDSVSGIQVNSADDLEQASTAEEDADDDDIMTNVEVLKMVSQYIDAFAANPPTRLARWEKEYGQEESEPMHSLEESEDDASPLVDLQKSVSAGEDTITSNSLPPAAAAAARALKEEAEKKHPLNRDPPTVWSASAESSDREDPPLGLSLSKEGGRMAFEVERNPRKKESAPVESKQELDPEKHPGCVESTAEKRKEQADSTHSNEKPTSRSPKKVQRSGTQTSEANKESGTGETESHAASSRISVDAPGAPGEDEVEHKEGKESRKTGTAGDKANNDEKKKTTTTTTTRPSRNVAEKVPRDPTYEEAERCESDEDKKCDDSDSPAYEANVLSLETQKVNPEDSGQGEEPTEEEGTQPSNEHLVAMDTHNDAPTPKHGHSIGKKQSQEEKKDNDSEDLDIYQSPTMKKLWTTIRKSPDAKGNNTFESFVQLFQLAFPFFEGEQPTAVDCARLQVQSRRKNIPVEMTNGLLEQLQSLQGREMALGLHPLPDSIYLLAMSRDLALRQEALLRRLLAAREAEQRRNVLIYSTAAGGDDDEAVEIDLSGSFKFSVKDYPDSDGGDEDKWWEAAVKLERVVEKSLRSDDIEDLLWNSTRESTRNGDSNSSYEPASLTEDSAPYTTTSGSNSQSLDEDIKGLWARRKRRLRKSLRRTRKLAAMKPGSFSFTDNETERSYFTGMSACSSLTTFRGGDFDEELWLRRQEMALWSGTGWLTGGKAYTLRNPKPIDAVATTAFFERPSFMHRRRNPGTIQWKQPYNPRTKGHPGYFDVDVRSLYNSIEDRGRPHPIDKDPWEWRDVKQRFLHEQSVSYNRNWFGKTKKLYGNCQIREPVCCPQSMEMPMKAGEWTKEWYTKPWSAPSPGASISTNTTHEEIQKIRSEYGLDDSDDDDNGSWEETPECGTFKNVRLRPGERISRVTPELTSSLRRSRWRKKHFPKGTFPY